MDELLLALEKETNASIVELSTEKIQQHKDAVFDKLNLNNETRDSFNSKLEEYRVCHDMKDVQFGFYIRWIPLKNPKKIYITNGGHICDIKIVNDQLQLMCKNNRGRFFQIKFDECVIFQKISPQEKVILNVLDYLEQQ